MKYIIESTTKGVYSYTEDDRPIFLNNGKRTEGMIFDDEKEAIKRLKLINAKGYNAFIYAWDEDLTNGKYIYL